MGQIYNIEIYLGGRDRRMGNWDLKSKKKGKKNYEANGWKFLDGTISTVEYATKNLRKQIRGHSSSQLVSL